MEQSIRIGAVSYLNTRPLIHQLQSLAPHVQLHLDLPSRLADQLAKKQLDVALIPAIEFFRGPDYVLVSDACIACRGPVLSVKVFFRVHPCKVRSLALDEGSRTSVALARILLSERFGITPRLDSLPVGNQIEDTSADAILLIGDRAIHAPRGTFVETWDLGEEWVRWTNLPFVFAMWAGRKGADLQGVEQALITSRDLGVSCLESIAQKECRSIGLEYSECLAYLKENLYFQLGQGERRGLKRFHEYASAIGLVSEQFDVELHDYQAT